MRALFRYLLLLTAFMIFAAISRAQDTLVGEHFAIYQDAEITYDRDRPHLQERYAISPGDRLVFEYFVDNAGEPGNAMVAPEYISFEVAKIAKKFRYKRQKIAKNSGIYIQMCRCPDKGIMPIQEGVIRGKRTAEGEWNVSMDVYVVGRRSGKKYHFQREATFKVVKGED